MDLRIIKTHKVIKQAFIELLSEQEYDDIVVQDILDKALVNRATFYKYYSGKSDLAGKLIDEFKVELKKLLLDRLTAEPHLLETIMENHGENMFAMRKQMLALLKIRTKRHNLYQDMFEMMKQNYVELAQKYAIDKMTVLQNIDYQATIMATIFMASLQYYFERDLPMPKDLPQNWQQMIEIVKI